MSPENWLTRLFGTNKRAASDHEKTPQEYVPPSLSAEEQRLFQRLFEPSFTLEEGLKLYHSVIADGRQFPAEWEMRVLELGVLANPDRKDMRERLLFLRTDGVTSSSGVSGAAIVTAAKARLGISRGLIAHGMPSHGLRWQAYADRIQAEISALNTPLDVLQYAQTKIGFEHRGNIHHEGKFTALYERELAVSFPHFADKLSGFADIADSAPDTTYEHNGRLISNILFYLTRIILSCLTYLPAAPQLILEVGGGYGAPARLWMQNPIARPRCYLILDMPESLFFADVFLRKEFGDEAVYYLTSEEPLLIDEVGRYQFILCPLPYFAALQDLPIDLVINTGSLQEMSEEWVGFYRDWLDHQRCNWFYSLNYFAQPINALWESGNLMSPRLSTAWTARLLRWNPAFVRMQADRDFLEALYQKKETTLNQEEAKALLKHLMERSPSGETLVELVDLVRLFPEPSMVFAVLSYAMRMPTAPKEALWLAESLIDQPLSEHDLSITEEWHQTLSIQRSTGTEAYY